MRINVHAGHNPDGKVACGAIGIIQESTEARKVKNEVISLLKNLGHVVHDCTCENGSSQLDVLGKIVNKCNSNDVDLDLSIHFNSGAGDSAGNGKTTGTEAYVYSSSSKSKPYAEKICAAISDLGYRNRGVKTNANLYVLKRTKAPAVLVECCFVDDRDDVERYNCQEMAAAIVCGITGQKIKDPADNILDLPDIETPITDGRELYRVQVIDQYGAFSVRANAERMQKELKEKGFNAVIVKS